jgi:hypothetical protein
MANITIEIQPNEEVRYSPGSLVRRGDTVTFQLVNVPGEVEVSFDDGDSCLSPPGPYLLNGGTLTMSSSQQTVSLTAAAGLYPFTVQFLGTGARRMGGELETKKGGIDVTTEPPEDPEDKKRK